ncbi:MAG: 30S ribosomal protein S17 [Gammaproteobacteria bacterium]|nr:30S ribosomal protein S17 [Gammaproteobacteria bacterium]
MTETTSNTTTTEKEKKLRTLNGKVTSAKMDQSIVVTVERIVKHPLYGKFIRRSSKYTAHDEKNQCQEGDVVSITPCRPVSKTKSWRLLDVIERPASS